MKKILLNLLLVLIFGNLCAQVTIPAEKKKVVYFDIDGKTISKKQFTDKVNNGQYSVDISTKNDLTYMAISKKATTTNSRKLKMGQRSKVNRKKILA